MAAPETSPPRAAGAVMSHPLDGCWAKIERANENIKNLEAEIAAFVQPDPSQRFQNGRCLQSKCLSEEFVASVLPPVVAEVLTPKNRLDMERAVIQKRVADFAANQKKFQQEREEYCTRTMADARATQWTAPRHLATDGPNDVAPKTTTEPTLGQRTTLPPNSQ
jgi:hypothetical protein